MKQPIAPKKNFEDFIDIIDAELNKRKTKWTLTSINWLDWDDVSQIIRIHIYNKWHLYDQTKPIYGWLNTIITNQTRNLIRNLYSNFARPCLKCYAAIDISGCKIYGEQCSKCPLFDNWKKRREPAAHVKIPVAIENHVDEVKTIFDTNSDISRHIDMVHKVMKQVLKPLEYKVYEGLYILNLDETLVMKNLGYTSNEAKRPPGYKQLRNLTKTIINKFKKACQDGLIEIV